MIDRTRAAKAAGLALAAIALICFLGPWLIPTRYDEVYPDYVDARPSLAPHPTAEEAGEAMRRLAARLHLQAGNVAVDGGALRARLSGALDARDLAFLAASDVFAAARMTPEGEVEARLRPLWLPLGADRNGRDLFARTLVAGQISLIVGALGCAVALLIGVAYGAVAGFAGGRVDMAMMRAVDALYALPFLFFVILMTAFFGRSFALIFLAIGAVEWLDMARIVRGETLSLKRREFVGAAAALGASPGQILLRHIAPNLAGPVAAFLAVLAPRVILLESFLSFLGLGVQEPLTSLGALVAEGARRIEDAPYALLFPAVLLTAILYAFNFLGDALRDALDPRGR